MRLLPKNVLYYGKDEPLPQRTALCAGPLSLTYESGDLRYIKLGDREVLRRVYVAVRDHNWGTVPPLLSNVQMDIAEHSFRITYAVENIEGDIDFFWQGTITGDAQGTVRFSLDGVARATFLRNRIGFCVLHPMRECAGQPCIVEKVDGTIEEGTFPRHISPHQPFCDMRAISHAVAPGVWAEVRFEGEVFEMEDQRNWTDASFKTYCTPLALPFPVEVEEGTRISQCVTLTLSGDVSPAPTELPRAGLAFSIAATATRPLPRIGLSVAADSEPLSQKELARLTALHLSHLRVDLTLSRPDYPATLRQAAAQANALGAPLEVALHLSDAAQSELASFVDVIGNVKPNVCTWLIFHQAEKSTAARWTELARKILGDYDPLAKFGSGTDAFFTELNRDRLPVEALDLVCYSLNPQVHAFDNASLVEALEAQAATVETARQFCGALPIAISPITLKMRFNPNATAPEAAPSPGELPSQVDVRQMSLFGAGWTTGSLKYVTDSDVYSVTYYETIGWRGVMERDAGSPVPGKFPSLPGSVFPLYHVLADVGQFAAGKTVPTTSSDPLRLNGLALREGDRTRVVLANLSPETQRVTVHNLSTRIRVRHLDETNAEEAMRSPEDFRALAGEWLQTTGGALQLDLLPFAIVRIDCENDV
jgi:hypothetical protein